MRGARRGEEVNRQTAGSAHDAQDPDDRRPHLRRVRGPHRGRAHFDQQSPPGGTVSPPDPGGLRVRGVHDAVRGRRPAEVHAERRRSALRALDAHLRLLPRGRAAAVPHGPQRDVLGVEGQRHRAQLQGRA